MSEPKRLRMVCDECGSKDVMRDAWAMWNEETQDWELSSVFDAAYCDKCDGECNIAEVDADDCEDEDVEYEALLPDGSRCEWDERLRTVGALRVPKE